MNMRYAKYNEIGTVKVDGKEYPCQAEFGCEYLEESDGEESCGFPIEPLRFSRMVNDDFGYLFDGKGIIWVYGQNTKDGDKLFYRSCFKDCATQILLKEESDFNYESLNEHLSGGFQFFRSDTAAGMKAKFCDDSTKKEEVTK
jgi:hypothetical protein